MGIPDHLTCLLRNLYADQEAIVRTRHGTTDWFQVKKGVHQGCILSPYLFNFYAEDIMKNARLDEAQAGIKIAGRNINNLRYEDDTTCRELVRHSTRDKGHEEGGSAYAKAGSSLRSPPGYSRASAPQKTRVCLLYCFVLSPLTLLGAVPYHHLALSVKELTYSSN